MEIISSCPLAQHEAQRELHSRRLKARLLIAITTALFGGVDYAASANAPAADTNTLDLKQWGLLAVQDGGRRKPVDTFAKEALIRITGRSIYTDETGRKWRPNDVVLSALLETHDWKNELMVLISFGKLKEQLGLDKTQQRFSFAQLAGSAELQRLANEAQALKRAEKPLERVQQSVKQPSTSRRVTAICHAYLCCNSFSYSTIPGSIAGAGGSQGAIKLQVCDRVGP